MKRKMNFDDVMYIINNCVANNVINEPKDLKLDGLLMGNLINDVITYLHLDTFDSRLATELDDFAKYLATPYTKAERFFGCMNTKDYIAVPNMPVFLKTVEDMDIFTPDEMYDIGMLVLHNTVRDEMLDMFEGKGLDDESLERFCINLCVALDSIGRLNPSDYEDVCQMVKFIADSKVLDDTDYKVDLLKEYMRKTFGPYKNKVIDEAYNFNFKDLKKDFMKMNKKSGNPSQDISKHRKSIEHEDDDMER